MFTSTASVAASPRSQPAPPSTSRRLRGLSYLRNYTSSHLSSHSGQGHSQRAQRHSLSRTVSYPSQSSRVDAPDSPSTPLNIRDQSQTTTNNHSDSSDSARPRTRLFRSVSLASSAPVGSTLDVNASRTRRLRNIGTTELKAGDTPMPEESSTMNADAQTPSATDATNHQLPTVRFVPHQDPRSSRPSLTFHAITRTLPDDNAIIRVGRYSERDSYPQAGANQPSAAPVGFKSKVVSRKHCEFWCQNGQWFIKDVKSSSGTFLNHIRLSQPNVESKPFPVNDGDVVQLGIDFRGGEEMIFRCVKMRIECNRGWQMSINSFNTAAHRRLRELARSSTVADDGASAHTSECSICLGSIAPCQSLFVAPCSHVWHYKCIRRILEDQDTYPNFLCPNCRAVADLEAEVDVPPEEAAEWERLEKEAREREKQKHEWHNHADEVRSHNASVATTSPAVDITEEATNTTPLSAEEPNHLSDSQMQPSSLLARRQGSHSTPPPLPLRNNPRIDTEGGTIPCVGPVSSSKPTTPQSGVGEGQIMASPNEGLRASTPISSDVATPDAPMTPTNDAGPFVIDGSAGGASGSQTANRSLATSSSANPA